jgi:fatty acyl-CoA reductase
MVEKILRVQPDVGQLYLLIQPQKTLTAKDRLKNNVRILR